MTLSPAPDRTGVAAPVAVTDIEVLFICGAGRSGSTLATCLLGQVDGVFAAGELRYLWRRSILENRRCGCGEHFHDCATWQQVLSGVITDDEAADLDAAQRRRTRARALLPAAVLPARLRARRSARELEVLGRLYRSITTNTGDSIVVDSSKLPTYAMLLADVPGVRLSIVHLVRDPRAVAYSWQRWRQLADVDAHTWMHRRPPVKSAGLWLLWNAVTGSVLRRRVRGRYLRMRYEDLVEDPAGSVRAMLELVDSVSPAPLQMVDDEVVLETTHTVAGNPARMRSGAVRVTADEEWVSDMPRRDRWLLTALTLPLLARYGYPVRVGRRPRS
jgi:hypothetical protein